jgi:hypothetical protein
MTEPPLSSQIVFLQKLAHENLMLAQEKIAAENYRFALDFLELALDDFLLKSLFEWRLSTDPRPSLWAVTGILPKATELIPLVQRQLRTVRNRGAEPEPTSAGDALETWKLFDFPTIGFAYLLLNLEIPALLSMALPPFEKAGQNPEYWGPMADSMMLRLLLRQEPIDADGFLRLQLGDPHLGLARVTYANYVAIARLGRENDLNGVRAKVARANDLYLQRANDDFFNHSPECDGGDGGERSLDYRLAAILNVLFHSRPEVLRSMPTESKPFW